MTTTRATSLNSSTFTGSRDKAPGIAPSRQSVILAGYALAGAVSIGMWAAISLLVSAVTH